MYAEELIGPKTVDTLPNETIEAFLDHGVVSRTLDVGLDEALAAIRAVEDLGIRMETVTDELIVEGVAAFTKSFEDLMSAIDAHRKALAPARPIRLAPSGWPPRSRPAWPAGPMTRWRSDSGRGTAACGTRPASLRRRWRRGSAGWTCRSPWPRT